jgi:hypothetical protein
MKRTSMTLLTAVTGICLLLAACPISVGPAEQGDAAMQPDGGSATDAQVQSCLDASDTTGPCPVAIGCDGGWTSYSSIATPAWMAGTLDTCESFPWVSFVSNLDAGVPTTRA